MDYIEFRSDASAHPTLKMREAMVNAIVGDDGYKDDPTTNELEKYAAKLLGMDVIYLITNIYYFIINTFIIIIGGSYIPYWYYG